MTGVLRRRRRDARDVHAQRKGHVRTQGDGHLSISQGGKPQDKQTCQSLDLGLAASRTVRKYVSVV